MRLELCEAVGCALYSRMARDELDRKLERYLPARGVFLGAGAHDGITDSNTYYLEKIRSWTGILVEPDQGNYEACLRLRPNSISFNCVLTENSQLEPTLDLFRGDRMAWVRGALSEEEDQKRRNYLQHLECEAVSVATICLGEGFPKSGHDRIDFMSLDVEGFEL